MLEQTGFLEIKIGPPIDTFMGAGGEDKARLFAVYGYAFLARKPSWPDRLRTTTAAWNSELDIPKKTGLAGLAMSAAT